MMASASPFVTQVAGANVASLTQSKDVLLEPAQVAAPLFVAQAAGANAASPTQSKDVLLEPAQVAALKLQGILKAGTKT
jgi:hypothetical protein